MAGDLKQRGQELQPAFTPPLPTAAVFDLPLPLRGRWLQYAVAFFLFLAALAMVLSGSASSFRLAYVPALTALVVLQATSLWPGARPMAMAATAWALFVCVLSVVNSLEAAMGYAVNTGRHQCSPIPGLMGHLYVQPLVMQVILGICAVLARAVPWTATITRSCGLLAALLWAFALYWTDFGRSFF